MANLLKLSIILLCLFTVVESNALKRGRKLSLRLRQNPHVNSASNSSLKMHDVYGRGLAGQENSIAYEVKISLGESLQTIPVTISTTFSGLWVPKKGCVNKGGNTRFCPNKGAFDPSLSKTVWRSKKGFNKDRVQVGKYMKDTFAFGTKECERELMKLKSPILFGAATQTTGGDQGVLGLGLPDRSVDGGLTSVFGQMIKDGLLDAPIFTTMYKPCADAAGCKKAGILTLGGVNKNSCEDIESWIPVPEGEKKWAVKVDKVQLNKLNRYKYINPSNAILDPTSTHIKLPPGPFKGITRQSGAKFANNQYTIECDKEWNLEFLIRGKEFIVGHEKLTRKMADGKCELLLQQSTGQWVLGAPFSQTYCIAHNFEKKEVGFSKIK